MYLILPGNLFNSNAALDGSDAECDDHHPEAAIHARSEEIEAVGAAEFYKRLVEQQQRPRRTGNHHRLPGAKSEHHAAQTREQLTYIDTLIYTG